MSSEQQRIGRQGEKLFSLLCTEADVTCNKSVEDDYGWDMLVEFPPRVQQKRPIDLRPVHLTASVQVKATRARSRSCRISLQNALRMAKSPIPSFVFLAVLKDRSTPRYFVAHVWEEMIHQWLKTAREADARGVEATNKEYVTVRFRDSDEHTDDALPWIEQQVRGVGAQYAATKLKIAETVGFERGYGIANVTLELDSPDDFINFQLGLKSSFKANYFQFHSERFGIRSAHPEIDLKDVEVTLEPEGKSATMRFLFPNGRCLAVPALLFHAFGPEGDPGANAWRVQSCCFEVVFTAKRMTSKASIKSDELLPIDDLAVFAYLQATAPDALIKIELELNALEIPLGTITQDQRPTSVSWSNVAFAIDALRDTCVAAAKSFPALSFAQLNASAFELSVLSALASERSMLLTFTPYPDTPRKFRWLLAYAIAIVGDLRYAAIVRRPIASDRYHGKRRHVHFGPAKIMAARVGLSEDLSDETIHDTYQGILDILSTEGEIMGFGDLRKMVSAGKEDAAIFCDLPSDRG